MPPVRSQATYDDVNLILRLYDMRREETMRKARGWFTKNFRPQTIDEMWKLVPVGSEENAFYRQVTSYWDMVASFIVNGVLLEDLFFESNRELLLVWVRVRPILPALREANTDPYALHNLEKVALRYIEWMNNRAPGSFEAFAKRIG
jgi:hypothetical protein